jgi:pilus assembly protein TadC
VTGVVIAAAVAALLCWPRRRAVRGRMRGLIGREPGEEQVPDEGVRLPVVIVAAVAVVGALVAGVAWWLVVALAVAAAIGARLRASDAPAADEVPLGTDLMAACLSAGATPADALSAAADAAGAWMRAAAAPVVRELRLGAPPEQAWASWLSEPRLAPLARSCARSGASGAAIAAELARLAARMRARQRAVVHERVARAAVWVVLPLGLCFLPAFVAVGVVPLVLGLLSTLH